MGLCPSVVVLVIINLARFARIFFKKYIAVNNWIDSWFTFQAQTNLLGPTRPPGTANAVQAMYPGLADYMGLELTQDVIRANMPEYLEQNRTTAMIRRPSAQVICSVAQMGIGKCTLVGFVQLTENVQLNCSWRPKLCLAYRIFSVKIHFWCFLDLLNFPFWIFLHWIFKVVKISFCSVKTFFGAVEDLLSLTDQFRPRCLTCSI